MGWSGAVFAILGLAGRSERVVNGLAAMRGPPFVGRWRNGCRVEGREEQDRARRWRRQSQLAVRIQKNLEYPLFHRKRIWPLRFVVR